MFRIIARSALTALPLAALSVCALAQNATTAAAPTAHPSLFQHMLTKMDTDGDGRISQAEYLAAATTRFQSMDTQGKGSIDAAEIVTSPEATTRAERGAQMMVKHLDTAGNGYVTADEFLAAAKNRFARMDQRGDGKLTVDELSAPRWSHGANHVQAQGTAGAGSASAGASGGFAAKRAQVAQKYFDKLDANHDGVVTQDEYLAAANAEFKQLDAAGNGQVTAAEIAASPRVTERANHAAERLVRHLDTNGDGVVSQDEYLAAAQKRFAHMDKNSDGFIDADEVQTQTHRWAQRSQPVPSN